MPLDAAVADVISQIIKKSYAQEGPDNFQITLNKHGLVRVLAPAERPILMQKRLLQQVGYEDKDRIEDVGREDNSYLCRFMFLSQKDSDFHSLSNDLGLGRMAKYNHVDLSARNLVTIPINLYSKAAEIISLNLSRNLSLDLPRDFIQSCQNLRDIKFNNNEARKLPPSLGKASKLTYLDVSNNRLEHLDHAELHNLTGILKFNLANNRLKYLPSYFGAYQSLRNLNISSNFLDTFPQFLCTLDSLVELDLSFNSISSLPDDIANMRSLEKFVITNNRLNNALPPTFSRLSMLRELDIKYNAITSIAVIADLPRLEILSADHNSISKFTGTFERIRSLKLNSNPIATFEIVAPALTLKMLNLSNCQLASIDESFHHMLNLERLVLDKNYFVSLPAHIGNLSKLEIFSIANNSSSVVSVYGKGGRKTSVMSRSTSQGTVPPPPPVVGTRKDSGLSARLQSTFAGSLRNLYLADNQLDDEAFDQITMLNELRVLNLSYNDIGDMPQRSIKAWPQLVELYLSGNELTTLPADDLEDSSLLQVLHINGNKFTNLPADISRAKKLTVLDCGNNSLKYNIANVPYDWNWNLNPKLRYLNLSGNKRLEIKQTVVGPGAASREQLADFNRLQNLRVLGLMDLNDLLEVSRAFGYVGLMPSVQAAPYVSNVTIRESDDIILLATRELWEYMSPGLIVDVVRSERGDLMRASQKLRDLAIAYGSASKIMIMLLSVSDLKRRMERSRLHRGQSMSLYPSGVPEDLQSLPRRGKKTKAGDVLDSTLQRLEAEIPAPTGQISIVFTDIKNSTTLWEMYPSAMRSAIKLHNEVMRDAFMVSFPTATSALLWCFAVQISLLEVNWPPEVLNSNPEVVYSLYPHALIGRAEQHQQHDRGIEVEKPATMQPGSELSFDPDLIWGLWRVSLRLEMLCSTLENESGRALQAPETELLERMKQRGGEVTERFLLNFMEHQVSRVETCTTTLALRHMANGRAPIGQLNELRAPITDVLAQVAEQMAELQRYKARFGELQSLSDEGSDTEQE
ncbi:Polyamine oxidase [Verticillium dahliae VDG1]|nr:Polyamine oxidase [Verticillium dahliae VDG1]